MRAAIEGFFLSAGLIIAIGPQNLYVLKQGLKKSFVFTTAICSAFGDAVLICLGCMGAGTAIASSPPLTFIAKWGGALFLAAFGIKSFRSAFIPKKIIGVESIKSSRGLRQAILTTFGFSFLNPHALLDTVVLIGTVGSQQPDFEHRIHFGMGATLASFAWFFSLAYGARYLSRFFQSKRGWQIFDFFVGCVMFALAYSIATKKV